MLSSQAQIRSVTGVLRRIRLLGDSARHKVSSNKEGPPCSEQNCLGTESPPGVVVRPRSRLPSPAASISAQTFAALIATRTFGPYRSAASRACADGPCSNDPDPDGPCHSSAESNRAAASSAAPLRASEL